MYRNLIGLDVHCRLVSGMANANSNNDPDRFKAYRAAFRAVVQADLHLNDNAAERMMELWFDAWDGNVWDWQDIENLLDNCFKVMIDF